MRNKILFATILFFSSFVIGCFEDEGNYGYEPLDEPIWNTGGSILMTIRAGETAKFRSSPYFSWKGDSAQRSTEVTYEWKLGYEILGNEANFDMPTDEVIRRIGLTKLDGKDRNGTFSIIEKETGVRYVKTIMVKITPSNASGDWCVVSEDGGNTKLSFVKRQWTDNGELTYELKEDIYPELNGGTMEGKPLYVAYAQGATNIGAIGALSIVTTSNQYEINCETMVKVGNLEEIPLEGRIYTRHDAYSKSGDNGMQTFVTDAEGKMYRRLMSKNNLAGTFGATPLVLDVNDYNISIIGQAALGYSSIPCYDALNRRMVSILFYDSGDSEYIEYFPGWGDWVAKGEQYKLSKLCSTQPVEGVEVTGCAPVWNMPAGTTPLHVWYVGIGGHPFMGGNYDIMGMIYNDASGKTWLTEFAADMTTGKARNGANRKIEFSGGDLEKGTCFLTSSYSGMQKNGYILYAKGNEVRYLNRNMAFSDNAYITLDDPADKVVCMAWAVYGNYAQLMVGTEKGDVIFYKTPYGEPLSVNPEIIKQFNLRGRIAGAKELDNTTLYGDKY